VQSYQKDVLFMENFAKAKEILPMIPWSYKVIFTPFFIFEAPKATKWIRWFYFNYKKIKDPCLLLRRPRI
jgi:hypothetical protein